MIHRLDRLASFLVHHLIDSMTPAKILKLLIISFALSSASIFSLLASQEYYRPEISQMTVAPAQAENSVDYVPPQVINTLPVNSDVPRPKVPSKIFAGADFVSDARSVVVLDEESGEVIFEQNGHEKASIASISKLMSAMVFLDLVDDLGGYYEIKRTDIQPGGKSHLYVGDQVRRSDLLAATLIASDNTAAYALIGAASATELSFVNRMNDKAKRLGLKNTSYVEPTGLDTRNVSSAGDVARILKQSMLYDEIKNVVDRPSFEFATKAGKTVKLRSTDELIDDYPSRGDIRILGGKTGYNEAAGFCFASRFERKGDDHIITVILGASTTASRFSETKKLVNWVYDNYSWQ